MDGRANLSRIATILNQRGLHARAAAKFVKLANQYEAEIQVRGDRLPVTARTAASPGERARLWKIVAATWPNYDAYQTRTDREIPVVILDPV